MTVQLLLATSPQKLEAEKERASTSGMPSHQQREKAPKAAAAKKQKKRVIGPGSRCAVI